MRLILISTSTFGRGSPEPLELLRASGFSVRLNPHGRVLEPQEATELLADADGLIAGTERLDRAVLTAAPRLKVIARVGSGMENVDLAAARERGIEVTGTPEPPARAVAELALAGMLAVLRDLCGADRRLREGRWQKPMGRLLGGKTVGIVGTGRAGRRLAELLAPFECRLLGFDTAPDSEWAASSEISYVTLDELLAASDIVSLHVPLTGDTRGLVDRRRIESMRDGSILVNCARGGLVDEAALADNLESGRLGGAYLDVFETEPYSGPLTDLPNIVLSPHIGSYASECRLEMEMQAASAVIRALSQGRESL